MGTAHVGLCQDENTQIVRTDSHGRLLMRDGPIYITRRMDPTKGIVPCAGTSAESDSHWVYVYEENRRPYCVSTGRACLINAEKNSVLIDWMRDVSNYTRILFAKDGHKYPIEHSDNTDRLDVVNGKITVNGMLPSDYVVGRKRTAALTEANGVTGAYTISVNSLPSHWLVDNDNAAWLYKNCAIGFVDGMVVCASSNVAEVLTQNKAIKRIRFNGGRVFVKQGYVFHYRKSIMMDHSILTAFDLCGRRCDALSLHARAGKGYDSPIIVSRDMLRMIIDIGRLSRL